MQLQPVTGNRNSAGVAFSTNRNGGVDPLDINAAVLHGFNAIGDLNELAGGLLGDGQGEFHDVSIAAQSTQMFHAWL